MNLEDIKYYSRGLLRPARVVIPTPSHHFAPYKTFTRFLPSKPNPWANSLYCEKVHSVVSVMTVFHLFSIACLSKRDPAVNPIERVSRYIRFV